MRDESGVFFIHGIHAFCLLPKVLEMGKFKKKNKYKGRYTTPTVETRQKIIELLKSR
jgi:hypothetical protein